MPSGLESTVAKRRNSPFQCQALMKSTQHLGHSDREVPLSVVHISISCRVSAAPNWCAARRETANPAAPQCRSVNDPTLCA
jgi:hypothetical protein